MADPQAVPGDPRTVIGVARHGQLKPSNPWVTLFKVLASALVVVLVSGGIVAAYAYTNLVSSIQTVEINPGETVVPLSELEGGFNILVVGSDSRDGYSAATDLDMEESGGARNDVNILLHVSQDNTRATAVSFSRDLLVPRPECTGPDGTVYTGAESAMLNEALAYGGLSCAVKTISQLTDLKIQYAAEIGFDGVIAMSNAVGGVTVCSTEPLVDDYIGLNLPAGDSTLKGEDALKFLRSRHGVGDGGDYSRISNQQVFLSSLIRTVREDGTLTDVTKLYGLATAAAGNMTFSTSLKEPDTMVQMALALAKVPLANLKFVAFPSTGAAEAGRLIPLEPQATDLMNAIRDDVPFTVSGTGVSVNVQGTVTESPTPSESEAPEDTAAPEDTGTPETSDSAEPSETPETVDLGDGINGIGADQVACSVPYYF